MQQKRLKRKFRSWSERALILALLFLTLPFLFQAVTKTFTVPDGAYVDKEEQFIEELTPKAKELQRDYQIFPSVLIAQAILESDWGESTLAVEDNNYFGIKGSSDDPSYQTAEFSEAEDWHEINATFRSYASMEESMEDYVALLKNGTTWNADQYRSVFEASNYQEAARAIQTAGYATDPGYADKLIDLIESYHLDDYD